MQPKLLQGEKALYLIEEWDGVNRSGMIPYANTLLVRADECAPYTAGGILLEDELRERHTMAATTGIVVAIGPAAFQFMPNGRPWPAEDPAAAVGDRVYFIQYAGYLYQGFDRKAYRVMTDAQIMGGFDMAMLPAIEAPKNFTDAPNYNFPGRGEQVPIPGGENVADIAGGAIINLED